MKAGWGVLARRSRLFRNTGLDSDFPEGEASLGVWEYSYHACREFGVDVGVGVGVRVAVSGAVAIAVVVTCCSWYCCWYCCWW